jgi:hypothetical protein
MNPVIIFRLSTIAIVLGATLVCGAGNGFAQGLSDASLAVGTNWSRGYMGLGGNLGRAYVKHPRRAKAVNVQRRTPRRGRTIMIAKYNPYYDTSIFLVSQSLDHTGFNVSALRTRTRGP